MSTHHPSTYKGQSELQVRSLPKVLLDLIGEYGLARTDGASELERQHRWELLIDGIKHYAAAEVVHALTHVCINKSKRNQRQ